MLPIRKTVLIALVLFAAGFSASAASPEPRLVLVYADDESQLTVSDAGGTSLVVAEGMTLAPGTTIRTKATTAEFKLEPNGSALKLGKNTLFRVRSLQGLGKAGSNDFAVLVGKIRLVAAKIAGVANAYAVLTPQAQAAVRGTDFAVEANADEGDWVCVKEGVVEFSRVQGGKAGPSIRVGAREFANVKNPEFRARKATDADIADKFEDLDFHTVKELEVPGHAAD